MEFKGVQDEFSKLRKIEEAETISYLKLFSTHRFKSLDISNHYIFEKSSKILIKLIKNHLKSKKNINAIVLQNCMISSGFLLNLLSVLIKFNSSLSVLDISNNKVLIEPIHTESISSLFSGTSKLKSLIFQGNICKNPSIFAELFSNDLNLLELNLYDSNLSPDSLLTISKILTLNKTIVNLNLGYNSNAFENYVNVNIFASSISENNNIQYLNLSDNATLGSYENLKQLCIGIKNNRSLKMLYLSGIGFNDTGVETICESLLKEMMIPGLDLSNNGIDDSGFFVLIRSIPSTLSHLNLSYNTFSENSSIILLSQFLRETKSLRKFNISHTLELENMDENCVEIFCEAIKINDSLSQLMCEGIKLSVNPDEFCEKFAHAIQVRKLSLTYRVSAVKCTEKNSSDDIVSNNYSVKIASKAPSNVWAIAGQVSNSFTERKDYIDSPNQEPIINTSRQFTFSTSFE